MSPARPVTERPALAAVAEVLRCPECGCGITASARNLRCERGHSFDIARQGYTTLLTGAATRMSGDTAAMLDARAAFQGSGHFTPIAEAVIGAFGLPADPGVEVIADIGAGTGYYLARLLDSRPGARGIALDVSKSAGRRCARAHPRAAAVVADAWRELPLRDATLTAALSIFAPRNPAEVARALHPTGRYIVVTPTDRHLGELIAPLGMVRVDPEKERRLDTALSGYFTQLERTEIDYRMSLGHTDITRIAGMGPSARHTSPAEQVAALPDPYEVTASVTVRTYRPTT